jgi:hypothetical protein
MAYAERRERKKGVRYRGIYKAADGRGRSWSVECDALVIRIVMLSRLTAATSWQWIPAPLLAGGVYQGIL